MKRITKKESVLALLVLICTVFIASCGGGGGAPAATPTGTAISGSVMAPESVSLGRISARSALANDGLRGKSGVTVTMYIIGNVADMEALDTGNALVHTTTDELGVYNLIIPPDITATSTIVVAIGGGDNMMRAIVVSRDKTVKEVTNISPYTELVAKRVVAQNQPVSNYTPAEIAAMETQVENDAISASIDLSTAASISAAVTALYTGTLKTNLDSAIISASDTPVCGNNIKEGTEACDSGTANTNTACVAEYGGSCSYCDTSCVSHTVVGSHCGDASVTGTEQCDAGANNTDNACVPGDTSCTYCDTSCISHTVNPPPPTCGNGTINGSEACDNGGNNTNVACTPSYASSCNYCDTSCQTHSVLGNYCGDNSVNGGSEVCDAGQSNTNTACNAPYGSSCSYCDNDCQPHTVTGVFCGDGSTNGSEQCDAGGNNGVVCNPAYGGTCNYCTSSCTNATVTGPSCGDGTVNGTEQCDAAGSNTNTPCNASYNGTCNYCDTSCVSHTVTGASCGDGTTNGSETCDDSNAVTEVCTYGQTSCTVCNASCASVAGATAYCGDGTANGSEQCDDSNTANGDGCSSTCQTETPPAFVSPQYTQTCVLPNGGLPRGNFPCGPNKCVADSVNDVVVAFNPANCNVEATIPVLGPESGCSSGNKVVVTRGQYGQFSLLNYNSGDGSYTLVNNYSSPGTGAGQLIEARQCAFDSLGIKLAIANDGGLSTFGHNYLVWDSRYLDDPTTHGFIDAYGGKGTIPGKLTVPGGMVSIGNDLFISDGTGRIQKTNFEGVFDASFLLNVGSSFYLGGNSANGWIYSQDSTAAIGIFSNTDGSLIGHVNVGGSSTGNISGGRSVTAGSDGSVYVTDDAGEKRYRLP